MHGTKLFRRCPKTFHAHTQCKCYILMPSVCLPGLPPSPEPFTLRPQAPRVERVGHGVQVMVEENDQDGTYDPQQATVSPGAGTAVCLVLGQARWRFYRCASRLPQTHKSPSQTRACVALCFRLPRSRLCERWQKLQGWAPPWACKPRSITCPRRWTTAATAVPVHAACASHSAAEEQQKVEIPKHMYHS